MNWDTWVGPKVVAEAGQCFGEDLDLAKVMADEAKEAGCWGFKIQMLTPELIASPAAEKYWEHGDGRSQQQVFADNGSLTPIQIIGLRNHCEDIGIKFLITPFDVGAVLFCQAVRVDAIKIASGDITNEQLLIAARRTTLPIVLSTGGATATDIVWASEVLGLRPCDTVLACSLQYPTQPEKAYFNRMDWLETLLPDGVDIGYSDHTLGTWSAGPLAALDAAMIEKHVIPTRSFPSDYKPNPDWENPDYEIGLDSDSLGWFVEASSRAWQASHGHRPERPHEGEKAAIKGARRCLYWTENVNAIGGITIKSDWLVALRPGPDPASGVGAEHFTKLVGQRLRRDAKKGALVEEADYWG